jgi:hypothetical protein
VTRATRAAKLCHGQTVPAEVIQELPRLDVTRLPKIKVAVHNKVVTLCIV